MIGILGDGQLSLMLVEAALSQGQDIVVAGDDEDSPVRRTYPELHILDDYPSFFAKARVVTLENEFYSIQQLRAWQKKYAFELIPDLNSFEAMATKANQFKYFQNLGLPLPKTAVLPLSAAQNENDHELALWIEANQFTFPLMVKKSYGGYDGYGVEIAKSWEDLKSTIAKFEGSKYELVFQELVNIKHECAQSIVLDGKGHGILLPLVQTFQRDGICHLVSTEHQLSMEVQKQIQNIFAKLKSSTLKGLFAIEFFVTPDDVVLVNESAPRPHNSQHITTDACHKSQFDYLIELCAYKPIKDETVVARPSLMVNLLGKTSGAKYQLKMPDIASDFLVYPKLYNKKLSRVGRKMGHVNVLANNPTAITNLLSIGEKIFREYDL
ncbi:MAG: ATP-grasp domain-containing protein [Bacteriovoracaceae bacterium]|nr:ATP-grasp domain-containing protein [Bacteriovoracaceae bacterium]